MTVHWVVSCSVSARICSKQPLAIEPIRFGPAGGALGLAGVAQEPLQAPGLQEIKQGNPVDPGRCHGNSRHVVPRSGSWARLTAGVRHQLAVVTDGRR